MIPIEETKKEVPYWKKVGGKDLTMLYNGIKMISGIEVGELTLHIIYAEGKVQISSKGKTISEYPIEKLKEAKKEFEKLIKSNPESRSSKNEELPAKKFPKVPAKSNFILVLEPSKELTIYDTRGKKPKEVMQFPPRQFHRAYIELMKLHCGRD